MKNKLRLYAVIVVIMSMMLSVPACGVAKTQKTTTIRDDSNLFITITGTYTLMNVSQIPERPVYNGRVVIILADGTMIALERGDDGIRTEEELKQFQNKTVQVTGILMPATVLWGDGSETSIVAEYITAIQEIQSF